MMKIPVSSILLTLLLLVTSCGGPSIPTGAEGVCDPDFVGATVPCNIAPLNFCIDGAAYSRARVEISGTQHSLAVKARRGRVMFPIKKWHRLLEAEKGQALTVTVKPSESTPLTWTFDVSPDAIDAYVTYRLIAPSFEVWHRVEIRERNITCFSERALSDWQHTDNSCMNCHTHGSSRGDLSFFHLRGQNGGTILNRDGTLRKLTLKTEDMPVGATYGDLHPSGRYAVYSWNSVIPSLRMKGSNRMEIFDKESDLVVADFDTNRLVFSPLTSKTDAFETFPTFSPDGKYIYFCRAPFMSVPDSIEHVRYSLVRIPFDPATGVQGDSIETVWDGPKMNGSASFPRISPDGRYLLFSRSDFGTFPIWHRETSLQMLDLTTGAVDTLPTLSGADGGKPANASSTFHSWSSNGRWICFASKRGDGQYGRVYFAHVDDNGHVSKPFRLPQHDPINDRLSLKSYNIPDLGDAPVPFDARLIGRLRKTLPAEPFEAVTSTVNP